MAWFNEISRSLTASVMLLLGNKDAVWRFNLTAQGFWRSFAAIILVFPLYFFISDSFLAGPENIGKANILVVIAKLLGQWGIWLVIMVFVTRQLGLAKNYARYVIVSNWTSVVVSVLIVLPVIGFQLGLLDEKATIFIATILRMISFYFSYLITKVSLETSSLVSIAIIVGEFATSMAVLLIIG